MSDKIRMMHPDLEEAVIFARPAQVAVRENSGWVVSPEDGTAAPEDGTPVPVVATTKASRPAAAPTQEG